MRNSLRREGDGEGLAGFFRDRSEKLEQSSNFGRLSAPTSLGPWGTVRVKKPKLTEELETPCGASSASVAAADSIRSNGSVSIRATGSSMIPSIWPGRNSVGASNGDWRNLSGRSCVGRARWEITCAPRGGSAWERIGRAHRDTGRRAGGAGSGNFRSGVAGTRCRDRARRRMARAEDAAGNGRCGFCGPSCGDRPSRRACCCTFTRSAGSAWRRVRRGKLRPRGES